MATAVVSEDPPMPLIGSVYQEVSGILTFNATDTTCDLPIRLSQLVGLPEFTPCGPENVAPTSTESTNIVERFWNRPSTLLMNLTRSAGTTSGLKVGYRYKGR